MAIEREEIDVRTPDGVARAWTCRSGEGPRPAVLLYTDAYGVRPAMHEMAGRIAEAADRHWRRLEAFLGETLD